MTGGLAGGPVGIAVVGAGVISDQYLSNLIRFPDLKVIAVADVDQERAAASAAAHGVPASGDLEAVLAIPDVELIVNLTPPAAHVAVASAALSAGRHVYGEKPLATELKPGQDLLALAEALGLRVGSAPDSFLGAGLQSAIRAFDAGLIGEPIAVTAAFQSRGPESWHPSPEFLFQVGAGPLFDMGPYYLTALIALLGPAENVAAVARRPHGRRTIGSGPKAGREFDVEVPTHVQALLDFASGPSATLTVTFDSQLPRTQIEVTGTEGTLILPDPNNYGGPLRIRARGEEEDRELPVEGTEVQRGIGVLDLARSIRAGVPHRASGATALHVLDIMATVIASAESAAFLRPTTVAERPAVLPVGWDPFERTL